VGNKQLLGKRNNYLMYLVVYYWWFFWKSFIWEIQHQWNLSLIHIREWLHLQPKILKQ